ncbi:PKD domain-containing protein [Marinobacterium sp. YM272]|uniref:PKD domain-containing protein n=1 Tax=Marinobacterium sp. YM272 TaxID=3421654 RepID=UPI003D7F3402
MFSRLTFRGLLSLLAGLVLLALAHVFANTAQAQQSCSTVSDCQVFPQYEASCVSNQCTYTCGTDSGDGCGPEWTRFVTDFQRNVIALDEPINWVTRIAGHNATESYAYGASIDPNQSLTVSGQLTAGARILAIDVHVLDGELWLCHNDLCIEHRESYSDIMEEIGGWLDSHPDEFVWITIEYLPYQSCEFLPDGECQDASMTFEEILAALEDGVQNGLGASRVYRPSDQILSGQDSLGRDRYVHPEFSPSYCSSSGNACLNDDSLCPVGETCERAYPTSSGEQQVRRWPTLRELRREGKQVMVTMGGTGGCCGDDCGAYTVDASSCSLHSTLDTASQSCSVNDDCTGLAKTLSWIWQDGALGGYYASNVKSASKDFDYGSCEGGTYGHFWNPDSYPTTFPVVGEARTLIDAAADSSGFIEEGDVAALMECNVARIAMDFVDAAEDTSPNACAVYIGCENELFGLNDVIPGGFGCLVATCPEDDTRILRSAWSWKWGVTPDSDDTRVFMNGVDGRWNPTDVENQSLFRCACGELRTGEPLDWLDRAGDTWEVTSQGVAFKPRPEDDPRDTGYMCQLACEAEHGMDFALPVNGYQNRKLYDALMAASIEDGTNLEQENVWVRLSRNAGNWSTLIMPWIESLDISDNASNADQRDFTAVVQNPDGFQTSMIFVGSDGVSSDFTDPTVNGTTETFEWTKPFGSEGSFSVEAQLWGDPDPASTTISLIDDATVDFDFEFANVPPTIIQAFTSLDRSGLDEICADVCIGHLLQQPGVFSDPDIDDPFQVRVLYGDADDNYCEIPSGASSGVCTGASGGTRSCEVDTDCGIIVPYTQTSTSLYQFEMTNLYQSSGVFNGTLVVDDGTDEAVHQFTVSNLDPPVAPVIGGGCNGATITAGDRFACSPSFSDLNAENTFTVTVDYGDGSPVETLRVIDLSTYGHYVILDHTFNTAGNFSVVVTVTDSDGLSDSQSYAVNVEAVVAIEPPVIQVVNADSSTTDGPVFPNIEGTDGVAVTRTFRIIDDNPAHNEWQLIIAWGDWVSEGSVVANRTYGNLTRDGDGNIDVNTSHLYPCEFAGCPSEGTGSYGVSVFARAVFGATDFGPYSVAHTFTTTITSDNNAPELDGLNTQGAVINEGELFSRPGQSFSDADTDDPWVVYVDYGDGTVDEPTLTGKTFDLSHTYADNGIYTVQVIVSDGAANVSESFDVQVNNVAPLASVGPDTSVQVGEVLDVSGSWSDPAGTYDEPYSWRWSVDGTEQASGDASDGETVPFSGQFATPGTRTLTFAVTDKDGGTSSASMEVLVGGSPPVADAGQDQTLECASTSGTEATLNGGGSYDPDTGPLQYLWTSDLFGSVSSVTVTDVFPLGSTTATLQVTDDEALTASDDVRITVLDTASPVITPPQDLVVECAAPEGTSVDIGSARVFDACDANASVTDDAPQLFPLGITTVEWTATDAQGNSSTAFQSIEVVDNQAPVVTASATPSAIWPPNHKMVAVEIEAQGADACDAQTQCQIVNVTSNDPVNGKGDGNTEPDWVFDGLTLSLRAERAGTGDGREYSIEVACTDDSGVTGSTFVTVSVSRDNR